MDGIEEDSTIRVSLKFKSMLFRAPAALENADNFRVLKKPHAEKGDLS
jgi:hypothetical protein